MERERERERERGISGRAGVPASVLACLGITRSTWTLRLIHVLCCSVLCCAGRCSSPVLIMWGMQLNIKKTLLPCQDETHGGLGGGEALPLIYISY